MIADYHIHTKLCKHAEGDPNDFREVARERNLSEICFTDHIPTPDGYDLKHRMALAEFDAYHDMVLSLPNDESPPVLFGIEADYYDGCASFLEKWIPCQPLDLVLGAVHYIADWGFDNPEERSVWDSVDVTSTWKAYFRLLSALADTRLFDVIAHLDLPKKFGYRPCDNDLKEMAKPVLDRVAAAGMAIEINTSGLRKPVEEIYPSPLLLGLAREREIPICFGSDAHRPEEVGYQFTAGLNLAREAGYTHAMRFRRRKKTSHPLP